MKKTNQRPVYRRIFRVSMLAVLMSLTLITGNSFGQGNRGRDRGNGNGRERSHERRNDVAVDRPNRGEGHRNNEEVNRRREYNPANAHGNRNNDWNARRRENNESRNNGWNDQRGNRQQTYGNRGGFERRNAEHRDNRYTDRRFSDQRRNMYTRDRPGYRPVYDYGRRPVYNRFDPCWKYNYLPRRNSYFYNIPSSYFSISFGGYNYRYWDGVFYRPFNNLFTVCAPPVGIYINVLPVGYNRIYVNNYPYYY